MVHFPAIVIGPDVDAQLQPYHQCAEDEIQDYAEYEDITDEVRREYENVVQGELARFYTWEQFAKHEYGGRLTAEGRWVSASNPNGKWDYWKVGGRWAKWLGRSNGPRAKFDFAAIESKARSRARKHYRKATSEAKEAMGPEVEYVDRAGARSFVPFAVVMEGQWQERGPHAWFEPVTDAWIDFVRPLLLGLDGDTLLTVVDCHT